LLNGRRQVEDDVEIGGVVFETLDFVIDHDIGAERVGKIHVIGRDRRKDARFLCLCELDREVSDTAGAAVDKNGLSRL
jgi:hypothetical protein